MTLLTTVFAAVITTVVWYVNPRRSELRLGMLSLMFWGAGLMWFVDAVVEYLEIGAEYFTPAPADMLNDWYLGMSVVALGLIIWLAVLLFKDPKGVVKSAIARK